MSIQPTSIVRSRSDPHLLIRVQIRVELARAASHSCAAESAARGYLLTNDKNFLADFIRERNSLLSELVRLEQIAPFAQRPQFRKLRSVSLQKLAEVEAGCCKLHTVK